MGARSVLGACHQLAVPALAAVLPTTLALVSQPILRVPLLSHTPIIVLVQLRLVLHYPASREDSYPSSTHFLGLKAALLRSDYIA